VATVVSIVAVVGGISLVVGSSFSAGQYYRTVGEVVAAGDRHVGETFRLAGSVVEGSISLTPGPAPDYTFSLTDGTGGLLTVHYPRTVPDAFTDGVDVVAEGRLVRADRFEAAQVIAKCPSKYEGHLDPEDVRRKEAEAAGTPRP